MKKKFTLIELIIVIVVIGLLAAMALPKVTGVVQNAKLSAMINDKEVLEKMMILYSQKNDNLLLLNENQELIVLNDNVSLIKLVQAENIISEDMKTIYTSLQENLKHFNDSEENLYRIDLSKANSFLSKKLKYGTKKTEKDFYVYSTKTNNVYYYNLMRNGEGEIYHNEINTTLKESELVDKKFSYNLSEDGSIINNKPIVELTNSLENLNIESIIKWTYNFIDEDKSPTKISFILDDIEYDSFEKIPTKLTLGDHSIKLKMQDSKGLWSNEVVKEFYVENKFTFEVNQVIPVKKTLNVLINMENISKIKIIGTNNKIYYDGDNPNIILDNLNYDTNYDFVAIGYVNDKEVKRINFSAKTEPILSKRIQVKGMSSAAKGYINTNGTHEIVSSSSWGEEQIIFYNTSGVDFTEKYAYITMNLSSLGAGTVISIKTYDNNKEVFYRKNNQNTIELKIDLSKCIINSNNILVCDMAFSSSSTRSLNASQLKIKVDY